MFALYESDNHDNIVASVHVIRPAIPLGLFKTNYNHVRVTELGLCTSC